MDQRRERDFGEGEGGGWLFVGKISKALPLSLTPGAIQARVGLNQLDRRLT